MTLTRVSGAAAAAVMAMLATSAAASPSQAVGSPAQVSQYDSEYLGDGNASTTTGPVGFGVPVAPGAAGEFGLSNAGLGINPFVQAAYASETFHTVTSSATVIYNIEDIAPSAPAVPIAVGFAGGDTVSDGGPDLGQDSIQAYINIADPSGVLVLAAGECLYGGPAACAFPTSVTLNGPLSAISTVNLLPNVVYTVTLVATASGAGQAYGQAMVDPQFTLPAGAPGVLAYSDGVLPSEAAPEPEAWALMLAGVALTGAALRGGRRRRALAA